MGELEAFVHHRAGNDFRFSLLFYLTSCRLLRKLPLMSSLFWLIFYETFLMISLLKQAHRLTVSIRIFSFFEKLRS